ncbi:hypothetical protein L0337_39000 [candidate division KSB1 bacterium]|nr:hypothetical protein [candidate division KSB1 bacterium]
MHQLKHALAGLENYLDDKYLSGQIHSAGDIASQTAGYLRQLLKPVAGWWCIGTQHQIFEEATDIVCYYSPQGFSPARFDAEKEAYIFGLIDIKFGDWGQDLKKLAALQQNWLQRYKRPALAWMVYGDHFNQKIHRENYNEQLQREKEIREWVQRDEMNRGMTILKFGLHRIGESRDNYEIREALNQAKWNLDKDSKYRRA